MQGFLFVGVLNSHQIEIKVLLLDASRLLQYTLGSDTGVDQRGKNRVSTANNSLCL